MHSGRWPKRPGAAQIPVVAEPCGGAVAGDGMHHRPRPEPRHEHFPRVSRGGLALIRRVHCSLGPSSRGACPVSGSPAKGCSVTRVPPGASRGFSFLFCSLCISILFANISLWFKGNFFLTQALQVESLDILSFKVPDVQSE